MITNEAIADEFSRLIREYHEGDEATRPEAWNLLADFAVENAAILTAALAAMPGPAVKVRELVFVEEVPNWFVARALGSTYEARLTDRGNVRVRNPIDRKWEYFHGKIQDALRALNSDYKARILAALTPAPDLQAENERLRAALEWYGEQAAATFRLKAIPDALLAIVVALSLDGGKRAKEALERT